MGKVLCEEMNKESLGAHYLTRRPVLLERVFVLRDSTGGSRVLALSRTAVLTDNYVGPGLFLNGYV